MKALVLENKVVQVANEEFPVASPLVWIDCPNECIAGWNCLDGNFSAPLPKQKTKEEILAQELPNYLEKIEALWDSIAKNDSSKIQPLLIKEQDALNKYNAS